MDIESRIGLRVATRWLPRIGDTLNFDGARGETLVVVVTDILHDYRTDYPDLPEPEVDVDADVHRNRDAVADELLDPVRLIEWVREFPFLDARPEPLLVNRASLEVGMDERSWETVTDWNAWALEVRRRRTSERAL